MQVVPKKGGMPMVKNDKDEPISTHTITDGECVLIIGSSIKP